MSKRYVRMGSSPMSATRMPPTMKAATIAMIGKISSRMSFIVFSPLPWGGGGREAAGEGRLPKHLPFEPSPEHLRRSALSRRERACPACHHQSDLFLGRAQRINLANNATLIDHHQAV